MDEPIEATFEAAMRAGEDVAELYADWLQLRGHPRGELIAIQRALRKQPEDAALRAEEARLIGELLDQRLLLALDDVELRWRDGFIESAELNNELSGPLPEILLSDPSTRMLRRLFVHDGSDFDRTVAALLRASPAPPLRKLLLANGGDRIGDLTELGDRYPLLAEIELHGDVEIGHLARARQFSFYPRSTLPQATAAAIAAWPALVDLRLNLHECVCTADDFEPLLANDALPALRQLHVHGARFLDALCPRLVRWPRIHAIEVLEFGFSELDDAGAEILIANRAAFASLRELRFDRFTTHLTTRSNEVLRHLREAFPLVVTDHRAPQRG